MKQRVGVALAVVGAIAGYILVGRWVGSTDCGVVSHSSPVAQCGFFESLVFRFENFAKMAGALILAQPGLFLWLGGDDESAETKVGQADLSE